MHPLRYTVWNYKFQLQNKNDNSSKNYIMMLWQKYSSLKWIRKVVLLV
jgi:hypothetical protein